MPEPTDYVLGQSADAARRLEIQDRHFAVASEELLDRLALRPADRVVELGCGPGGLTRRILRRLGPGGVVVAVDSAPGLLDQARATLAGIGPANGVTSRPVSRPACSDGLPTVAEASTRCIASVYPGSPGSGMSSTTSASTARL